MSNWEDLFFWGQIGKAILTFKPVSNREFSHFNAGNDQLDRPIQQWLARCHLIRPMETTQLAGSPIKILYVVLKYYEG